MPTYAMPQQDLEIILEVFRDVATLSFQGSNAKAGLMDKPHHEIFKDGYNADKTLWSVPSSHFLPPYAIIRATNKLHYTKRTDMLKRVLKAKCVAPGPPMIQGLYMLLSGRREEGIGWLAGVMQSPLTEEQVADLPILGDFIEVRDPGGKTFFYMKKKGVPPGGNRRYAVAVGWCCSCYAFACHHLPRSRHKTPGFSATSAADQRAGGCCKFPISCVL